MSQEKWQGMWVLNLRLNYMKPTAVRSPAEVSSSQKAFRKFHAIGRMGVLTHVHSVLSRLDNFGEFKKKKKVSPHHNLILFRSSLTKGLGWREVVKGMNCYFQIARQECRQVTAAKTRKLRFLSGKTGTSLGRWGGLLAFLCAGGSLVSSMVISPDTWPHAKPQGLGM